MFTVPLHRLQNRQQPELHLSSAKLWIVPPASTKRCMAQLKCSPRNEDAWYMFIDHVCAKPSDLIKNLIVNMSHHAAYYCSS
ncbi:hypothetical protein DPMN_014265 [Dreissena polymorpha]|uniref:Uncharacterized protein n=1 Tax=Dreissena polymorpha TaxID=45954 RepID=A0A9D4N5P7_DREPO|nr:hypothetical protein DPMN_014265 [Dreissena polymorpha]